MATKHVLNTFKEEMKRFNLSKKCPVAVAVSGGSDSTALLYLAKQVFSNVLALTVDHRLRDGSAEEARATAEMAADLGVTHHVLPIDWEGSPPGRYKMQKRSREKRYLALLEHCNASSIAHLMTAHHIDDQIETMVYRMAQGSGLDGLACIHELSKRVSYPQVQIIRPLLQCHKEELRAVCREAGLQWIEDDSNFTLQFTRNYIRHILSQDPTLKQGLEHMYVSINQTRKAMTNRVVEAVRGVSKVNTRYGYVVVHKKALIALPKPIVCRVMGALLKYVSVDIRPVKYKHLDTVLMKLPTLEKMVSVHGTLLFPLDENTLGIAAAVTSHGVKPHPIAIGESIHWNKRWIVNLVQVPDYNASRHQFFVRHFNTDDHVYVRRGVRVVRSAKLPPVMTRLTLPVIIDENGNVVLIPHFKYRNREYGVSATVHYRPLITFEYLANQYQTVKFESDDVS